MIAKVSIDRKASNIADVYDYNIPSFLEDSIAIGASVFVPFGHDSVFGYVIDITGGKSNHDLKDIIDCVSDASLIGEANYKLATELASDLNCSMANVLSLMQPSFIKGQKQKYLYINDYSKLDANIAMALGGKNKVLIDNKLAPFIKQINNEIKNGNITQGYDYFVYGKNKKVKVYSILDDVPQRTPKATYVMEYLRDHPASTIEDIKVSTNVGKSVVKRLLDSGYIKCEEITVSNNVEGQRKCTSRYEFSFEEQNLIDYYLSSSNKKPFLLFTNKEEFKLHFMLKLINENYNAGKKTVIIYPNMLSVEEAYISLKRYLRNYDIITYHSKNSNGENYNSFNKILDNSYDVLIGTTQAVMLPIKDVSTIILNDVDDEMYISETYPYHSYKEAAIKKAKIIDAKIILESATPAVEDYYFASTGKYSLLSAHNTHQNDCEIVNMNIEALESNDVVFSNALKNALDRTLANKKIALLIVNNVAFSTQIKCRKCGKVLKCPNCKVPLVYLKKRDAAKCSYCNYETREYNVCKCGSINTISLGFGLEQVAEKLSILYPSARVIQANSQYMANGAKLDELIQSIEEGEVDIIIGTNALTKMVCYDNMDLVGLLYVDSYLNMSNYLGSEYTYNLIAKVSNYPHMVIQTYNPTHFAITNAINNNYEDYYALELDNRQMLEYPPFKELSMILIKGEYNELFHFAYYFKKAISHNKDVVVLGPLYDYHLQGVKLIVKHNDNAGVEKILNDSVKHFANPKIVASYHRYTRGG